jgi:hypothetical protein
MAEVARRKATDRTKQRFWRDSLPNLNEGLNIPMSSTFERNCSPDLPLVRYAADYVEPLTDQQRFGCQETSRHSQSESSELMFQMARLVKEKLEGAAVRELPDAMPSTARTEQGS